MLKLTAEEKETQINWDQASQDARIYTFDPRIVRRLKALGVDTRVNEQTGEVEATILKKWIKISAPRVLSDEQKAVLSERLKAMREGK